MSKVKGLKQKAVSSLIWTALQKYSTMFIRFISGIILARLLTPYDYGCIGMLAIFMVLSNIFIDCGFASALIQKKNPTQEDYSTIFWWNLGMATLMYIILFLSAPTISYFYKIPLLCDVLRVQGLVLFLHALNLIQRNQLKKKLNFKLLSIVSITTSFISLSVTIYMAYNGFGVWALVTQNIITSAIPSLVFWFYVRWRPMWTFSWKSFRELFSFGVYMFMTHLVNEIGSKISLLFIGKIYSPITLGYYSKAFSTESLISSSVSSIFTQITYPLYAQVQDDKDILANMIKRLTTTIAYITFPLLFILIVIAKPIFVLLYSERWLQSVPYFQILCLCGIAICLQSVNTQSIAAIGKSKTMFHWALLKRTTGSTLVIGGLLLWGMRGLLVGCVLYTWFCYFVNIGLVSKYIGYNWKQQLSDLLPIGMVSMLMAVFCYFVVGSLRIDNIYIEGLLKAGLFVLLYLGWSFVFKPEAFQYTLSVIPERIKVWNKRKMIRL